MTKTNKDWVEKTIKEMWKARVVNYDPYLEKDQVYKEGWEQGFRFALYKKDQQHKQELEAQEIHIRASEQAIAEQRLTMLKAKFMEMIGEDEDYRGNSPERYLNYYKAELRSKLNEMKQ